MTRQVLVWLDHIAAVGWDAHLRAIHAPRWMREVARIASKRLDVRIPLEHRAVVKSRDGEEVVPHSTTRRAGRWKVVREAAARDVVAKVLGEKSSTVRRRIQHFRKRPRTGIELY